MQVVASRLRSAVGDGVVTSEGGGYTLPLQRGALDADIFGEHSGGVRTSFRMVSMRRRGTA